jgi:hypothetical protein
MMHLNSLFKTSRPALGLLLAALAAQTGHAQTAFQSGTLSVIRYGDRASTTLSTATVPVSLEEYTTAGTLVRTIDIPPVGTGNNFNFVGSAFNNNSDGIVGISPDRSRLSIGGYNLAVGNGGATGSTASRVVGVFTANGAFQSSAAFAVNSGQPLRSTMVTNSGELYLGVGGGGALGLRYAAAPAASATPTVVPDNVITASLNTQKMQIYNGDLYVISTSTTAGGSAGRLRKYTGLPTVAGTNPTDLPGIPVNAAGVANSSTFVMFDVNPAVAGPDLLYYTDDVAAGSNIYKYTYNGTTWTARGTYTVSGTGAGNAVTDGLLRDMTGRLENGLPVLYAVSYSSLLKFTDAAAYTANASMMQVVLINNNTYNAQNTTGTAFYSFKGISFSPGTREAIALATAPAQLQRQVQVYPNPAQGAVQLSLPTELQAEELTAAVINVLGQTVHQQTLAAGAERTLPLVGLAAGVYTLRLETSRGSINKRLVIE